MRVPARASRRGSPDAQFEFASLLWNGGGEVSGVDLVDDLADGGVGVEEEGGWGRGGDGTPGW